MKNQEYQKSYVPANVDSSCEEMPEEIIGDKQLYNWLYQQEEKDYYLCEKDSASLPDFLQEALFVEY
ncbi:MAG: hypothetical protein HQL12_09550 [Candidatus Omnitrophica bacterium]|nr:hypothetical protein [Candidatus Omnitrophota bacterium]